MERLLPCEIFTLQHCCGEVDSETPSGQQEIYEMGGDVKNAVKPMQWPLFLRGLISRLGAPYMCSHTYAVKLVQLPLFLRLLTRRKGGRYMC